MLSKEYRELLKNMDVNFLLKEKNSIITQLSETNTMDPEFYTLTKKLELIYKIIEKR